VDIDPSPGRAINWSHPMIVTLLVICGISIFINLVLLIVTLKS
jgi:hypothetical protein